MRGEGKISNALLTIAFALILLAGCGEDKAPKPKTDEVSGSQPVRNVESLPSGTIREGARTMNTGAGLGNSLEQQKQARDGELESQGK